MFYLPAYERLSTCALAFMNHSKEILYMVFAILLKKEICIINKIILNLIINFTRSLYHVFHRKLVNEFHTCIYQHDLGYFPDNLPVIWDKCSCGQVTSYKILKYKKRTKKLNTYQHRGSNLFPGWGTFSAGIY